MKKIKTSIREKRIDAMYGIANASDSNKRKEMLSFLLAIINHNQIKDFCDNFDLKIDM